MKNARALIKVLACFWMISVGRSSLSAVGDTVSASVDDNGWKIAWTLSGMATNGVYNFGLGSSNQLTAPKFVVTWTAQGFDGSANATTLTATNYGVARARAAILTGSADPNVADETVVTGTNVLIKVSLDDIIPQGASNITATIGSGVYIAASKTNSSASVSVSNSSTQPYFRSIANWVNPPMENHTGSDATLELVAFHRSGRANLPVRGVQIFGTDEHSNTVSGVFTNWTLSTGGDAIPFGLIQCVVPITNLTQGDKVRWDFRAFPWIGDSASVLDTRSNEFTGLTPMPTSITNLVNRTGALLGSYALVRTNGLDASGVALTATQYATNAAALTNAFLTIKGALMAIAGTNNTAFSRNDVDASYVLLDQGNHTWNGGTITGGATNYTRTWATITTNVGAATASTIINNSTGSSEVNNAVRFKGLSFGGSINILNNIDRVLFEDCVTTSSASQFLIAATGSTMWYFVRGTVGSFTQGLRYAAGYNTPVALIRGTKFDGFSGNIQPFTMVGALITNSPGAIIRFDFASQPVVRPDFTIIYTVAKYSDDTLAATLQGPQQYGITNGYFIGNVLLESVTNNINNLAWDFGSANSIQLTNCLIWHVTDVGRKNFVGYNDTGSSVAWRVGWQWVNNYSDDYNNKSFDHGTTVGGGANTNRVGAELLKHGVGYSGSIMGELANIGASGSFLPIVFAGVNSWYPASTTDTNFVKFTQRGSFDGGAVSGLGNGNYRPSTNSPLIGMPLRRVLPFGLGGGSRGAVDASGAFESGVSDTNQPQSMIIKFRVDGRAVIVQSVTIK